MKDINDEKSSDVFSMKDNEIDGNLNFLFCFDNNYNLQAFTAIFSLLENVSKKINIHVIHNKSNIVNDLPDVISKHTNLANFTDYTFKDLNYNFPNLNNVHLSEATYYRLFIENYLPSKIKLLVYLDGDTVCIEDPIDLIESQLIQLKKSEKVISARTEYTVNEYPDRFDRLNMNSSYFNAGVLLIDYEKWRDQGLSKALVEHMKKIKDSVVNWDQDVINSLINGDYIELNSVLNFNANSLDKLEKDKDSPIILHYIGSKKPWLTSGALRYPNSSNYYHRYYSKITKNTYHIAHKWRRASLFQYLGSLFNLKLFRLDKPFVYTKELFISFFNNKLN